MKTLEDLKLQYEKHQLHHYFDEMKKYARNAIKINLEAMNDEDIDIGSSKIGGLPDLPKDIDWFINEDTHIPMAFVAQINFAQVKEFDIENQLPEKGILYLFYDCSLDGMPWGFDPKDKSGKKVFYYDGNIEDLERKPLPINMDKYSYINSAKLSFNSEMNIPDYWSYFGRTIQLNDEENDRYWDLKEEYDEVQNKLLGHSDNIQGEMELECELVTHGIYCGNPSGYQDPKRKELEKNVNQWHLLLQIDTNDEIDMIWGDCGRIYLWITDENLEKRNFEDSWLILQCY